MHASFLQEAGISIRCSIGAKHTLSLDRQQHRMTVLVSFSSSPYFLLSSHACNVRTQRCPQVFSSDECTSNADMGFPFRACFLTAAVTCIGGRGRGEGTLVKATESALSGNAVSSTNGVHSIRFCSCMMCPCHRSIDHHRHSSIFIDIA